MKVVLLVGGFGTRLLPLTLTRPKHMLPVGDMPLLERIMEWLGRQSCLSPADSAEGSGNGASAANAGKQSQLIDEAVFSMGYQPDAIISAYPDRHCSGLPFTCAIEASPLGTAGALKFAAGSLAETFIAMNGDIYCDIDLGELVAFHKSAGAEATLALTQVDDPSRFGVVVISETGKVLSFEEKPEKNSSPSTWINAGIYVMEPSVLLRIPDGQKVSLEREIFPAIAAEGKLFAQQSDAAWLDVGTPESYIKAQPTSSAGGATIMAGAEVAEDAVVENSVLLPHSKVKAGAIVRNSIVGEGAVIAEVAEITNFSVVADEAEVPPGTCLTGARYPKQD